MFAITVLVGPAAWSLLFKTRESCASTREKFKTDLPIITVEDDFGQEITVKCADIHGFMIEDMDQSKLAHVERALHQMRMQGLAQQRAEHDPSTRVMRGPAVLSPGMMMPPAPGFNGG